MTATASVQPESSNTPRSEPAAPRPRKNGASARSKAGMSGMRTAYMFLKTGTCAEATMNVVDRAFDDPLPAEERSVMPLAGGIGQHGYQCGMLWGSTLAAGLQAYRRLGPGPNAEAAAVAAAQRIVTSFRACHQHIDCLEITETDWRKKLQAFKFLLKGGPVSCVRRVVNFAPVAFGEISAALSDVAAGAPAAPVSCAALVAKRMGQSDLHATMAAGFAGGIGLSGGACGALGAAIWIVEMTRGGPGASYDAVNARASETVERFLKASDYQFECSAIVGRKFENTDDHAGYLQSGGCCKIIDVLAGALQVGAA